MYYTGCQVPLQCVHLQYTVPPWRRFLCRSLWVAADFSCSAKGAGTALSPENRLWIQVPASLHMVHLELHSSAAALFNLLCPVFQQRRLLADLLVLRPGTCCEIGCLKAVETSAVRLDMRCQCTSPVGCAFSSSNSTFLYRPLRAFRSLSLHGIPVCAAVLNVRNSDEGLKGFVRA